MLGFRSHRLVIVALATVGVAASGCGGGSSSSTSAATSTPSVAPSATPHVGLLGSYATTITGQEHFPIKGADRLTPGTPSTGKWILTLTRTSATLDNPDSDFQATNKVVYGSGRITFAASTGCDANLTPETPGVYLYRLVGGHLTFREVRDSCLDRAGVLTGETWQSQ